MTPQADALARLKALRDEFVGIAASERTLFESCRGEESLLHRGAQLAYEYAAIKLDALLAMPDPAPQVETARCATCRNLSTREDPTGTGEFYSFCDVLGQLPDELPHGFHCSQYTPAAHPERKDGESA